MKFSNSIKLPVSILGAIQLIMCSSTPDNAKPLFSGVYAAALQSGSDSSKIYLQKLIDSAWPAVAGYSRLLFIKNGLAGRRDSIAASLIRVNHNTDSLENAVLLKLCRFSSGNSIPAAIRSEAKEFYSRISATEKELLVLRRDSAVTADSLVRVNTEIIRIEPALHNVLQRIQAITKALSGPISLNFNNTPYRLFFATAAGYTLRIHCKKSGEYTFAAYKNYLAKSKKDTVLMMTNGGMFKPDHQPQGLLVSEGKEYSAIDTTTLARNGNFYLYPNGIFYTDTQGRFYITETQLYRKLYAAKNKLPQYATQSGPVLVSNSKIHAQFMYGSANINIRSGVGIPNDDRAIFLISDRPVNFYDFSMIFLYFLNCSDALYLDGAISKMYFNTDKAMPEGTFGPMISILKK
jgi:uncharacterized protein YigE (DUF2233 family)